MKMGLFGRMVDSLALAFTLASCLQASIDRQVIQGTVTDPQGGVIPRRKSPSRTSTPLSKQSDNELQRLLPGIRIGAGQIPGPDHGARLLNIRDIQREGDSRSNRDSERNAKDRRHEPEG